MSTSVGVNKVSIIEVADCPHRYTILSGKTIVGTIILKPLNKMNNYSILDDADNDELKILIPIFNTLSSADGVYIEEITLCEKYRFQGIGQQVIGNLLKNNNTPLFLYSLAEAEDFWQMLNFEQIVGYYYMHRNGAL